MDKHGIVSKFCALIHLFIIYAPHASWVGFAIVSIKPYNMHFIYTIY